MKRSAKIAALRLRQTARFGNPVRVLTDLATSRTPLRRDELTFELPGGGRIVAPNFPGARVPVYEIFIEDVYDVAALTDGLRQDAVVLDIGGHIGCFSVALGRAMRTATVHTYEASPVTVEWTRRNVAGNGLSDRVHVNHCAMSDHEGTLEFADNGRGSGLNGITAPSGSVVTAVPCITFDEAVRRAGGTVDLVKLDTEGAEFDIVLASSPASWAGVRRVVLEYHDVAGHHVSELESFFADAGLSVVRRVGRERVGGLWLERKDGDAGVDA